MVLVRCGRTHRTYFSATKWDWLKDNVESVKEARRKGTLMAGTVDTWLVYVRFRCDDDECSQSGLGADDWTPCTYF